MAKDIKNELGQLQVVITRIDGDIAHLIDDIRTFTGMTKELINILNPVETPAEIVKPVEPVDGIQK